MSGRHWITSTSILKLQRKVNNESQALYRAIQTAFACNSDSLSYLYYSNRRATSLLSSSRYEHRHFLDSAQDINHTARINKELLGEQRNEKWLASYDASSQGI